MCNADIIQQLEDALLHVEHLVNSLDKVTFTEQHAKELLVIRQFMYGVVYETSLVLRANSKLYY